MDVTRRWLLRRERWPARYAPDTVATNAAGWVVKT
ncbi:MAG: hypothetical protein JWR16_2890 [Nevskia sp.]|nr:hypothetical protein [Nevskia sp.]